MFINFNNEAIHSNKTPEKYCKKNLLDIPIISLFFQIPKTLDTALSW